MFLFLITYLYEESKCISSSSLLQGLFEKLGFSYYSDILQSRKIINEYNG